MVNPGSGHEGKVELNEFAPAGCLILTKNNVIREVDAAACRILNIRKTDFLMHRFIEFIAGESRDDFYWCMHNVLTTGTEQKCEVTILCPDGKNFRAGIELAPHPDGIGASIRDTGRDGKAKELRAKSFTIASYLSGMITVN